MRRVDSLEPFSHSKINVPKTLTPFEWATFITKFKQMNVNIMCFLHDGGGIVSV
jgi:hypothetical protein